MILSESHYKTRVLQLAEDHFRIRREVVGKLFNNRCKIDAIITPKDLTNWANKEICFGVEFKHFSENYNGKGTESANMGYYTKQFKQIIDYSYAEFPGLGRIPILISPPIFNNMTGLFEQKQAQLIKNCMGQCNVGELYIDDRNGLSIIFNTGHNVWNAKWGVGIGKTALFKTKIGSGAVAK